jgi:deoxyribose-phosphate aldolase
MADSVTQYIDHAVLHPTQTDEDLRDACRLCDLAHVASICVKPFAVPLAVDLLIDSSVKVGTVIGFPHGGTSTAAKVAESHAACCDGATELDMVANLGLVFGNDWDGVLADIRAVVEEGHQHGAIVKVIFESGLLVADDQKIQLCRCSQEAGAAFVKTSTGFGFVRHADGTMQATGATEHDIRLMREHTAEHVGVKASGGIRSLADARRFVELGATRLGTSATKKIWDEQQGAGGEDQTEGDY